MSDLRWFAPNAYCRLVVPALRARGFSIATEGDEPARLAVAMDGQCAVEGYQYARRHRVPLVLYIWDLPPWRLGGGRSDLIFELGGQLRLVPRLWGRYRERAGFYSRLRFVARRADRVWVPSHATARDLERRFGVESEVVPYCYDSNRFTPSPWNPPASLRLFAISRMVPHKNQVAVIRAAALMRPKPVVHLVGRGPTVATVADEGRRRGVDLVLDSEWQSDEAVVAAYRAASVVIAPSRFEGLGLSPIEAIASLRPAVASSIPPHREFVGSAATFFELEDDASLVAAIGKAIERGPADPASVAELTIEAAAARLAERLAPMVSR